MSISDKKAKQSICDHYNCDYEEKKVLKCRYCGRYFCEEHINPNKTSIDGFSNHNDFKVAQGHGCSGYSIHTDNEKKIQFEKENDALNRLTGKIHKLSDTFVSYEDQINEKIIHKPQIQNHKIKKNKTDYPKVDEKYRKEYIGKSQQDINLNDFEKPKSNLKQMYSKIKSWLNF